MGEEKEKWLKVMIKVLVILTGFAMFHEISNEREEEEVFVQNMEETVSPEESSIPQNYEIELVEQREETEQNRRLEKEEKNYEKVRVLIMTQNYEGYYHDRVDLLVDGEKIHVELLPGQHASYQNAIVCHFKRADGNMLYPGELMVCCEERGYLLINYVDMEEYVKRVLPSEMPSAYPQEALKAQAVCARTYAAYQMNSRLDCLPERLSFVWKYADVDDSTNYQVYNNRNPDEFCNVATDMTKGEIRMLHGQPQEMRYYSTSAVDTMEMDCPWYSWEYVNEQMSVKNLIDRISECEGDAIDYRKGMQVKEMKITSCREDGRARELKILTTSGEITINGEYDIRRVLCDRVSKVKLQNGSECVMEKLLPSAYFTIQPIQKGGSMIGYKVLGKGFGHGDGMSQNGAKAYASQGYSYEDILNRYFAE